MDLLRRLPAALVWPGLPLLYLLLPGHPLGLLRGTPLSTWALGVALGVVLLAWCGARPTGLLGRLAALVGLLACGLKLGLAWQALPYGLEAAYSAGGDPERLIERSTEWRLASATRVDRELELVGDQFPLHFFNDQRRFNYYTAAQPRRDLLPFSAVWRGWLVEPANGQRCFRLRATGSAELRLAGLPAAVIQRASHLESRETCGIIADSLVPLEVRYARPQDGVPYLEVRELRSDKQAFGIRPERLLRAPVDSGAITRDAWLGLAVRILDILVVSFWIATLLVRLARDGWRRLSGAAATFRAPASAERSLLSAGVLAAFFEALAAYRHFEGKTAILSGGNDWLAYANYARDVLLNGLLMTGGKELGQGETFYYQPLYSYFLAGLHVLLGEPIYGPLVAQYVLVAVAGALTYFLARELFGRPTALVAFALFWLFRYLIFNEVAGLLLSENLLLVLVPPMLLLLVRWQRTFRFADLAGAAFLLGLAILTRSTPLLFLPPVLLYVAVTRRDKFGQWRSGLAAAALFLVVSLSIASLVGVRNYVVAGRPALLPESTSANLWEAHRPSAKVNLDQVNRDPLYNRLGLDRQTREVLEFIRQDPPGYAGTLAVMGLYAVGVTGPALGTGGLQYELLGLTALYLCGMTFVPAVRARPLWPLHAFVLTHFLQMMVFFSHQYGFRLPMPMYGPMIVVAGAALAALVRISPARLGSSARPAWKWSGARPAAVVAVFLLVAVVAGWEVSRPRDVEERVFGLGGSAGSAARVVARQEETWLADRVYFGGRDGRSFGVAYLPGLAYREMKSVDTEQAFVWPPEDKRAVLIEFQDGPILARCWRSSAAPAGVTELPLAASTELSNLFRQAWFIDDSPRRCPPQPRLVSFGGYLELLSLQAARPAEMPGTETVWRVLQRPSFRVQPVLEMIDAGGAVQSSAPANPYASGSWEPGEVIVARLPLPLVEGWPNAAFRLAISFTRGNLNSRLPIDDPLPLYGQTRFIADE